MADNALDWVKGNHGLATECYRAVPAKTCNIDGEDYPCRTIRAIAELEAEVKRLSDPTNRKVYDRQVIHDLTFENSNLKAEVARLKALLREWTEINDTPCDVDPDNQHCYGHAVLVCYAPPCLVARTRAALGEQRKQSGR